jgi:hypothetical protein
MLLAYGIYIAKVMDQNASFGDFNIALPLPADLYLIIGIFVQVRLRS